MQTYADLMTQQMQPYYLPQEGKIGGFLVHRETVESIAVGRRSRR